MKAITRRALVAGPLFALVAAAARGAGSALPMPGSLAAALQAATARRRALVVLASIPGCPWCKLVRESYLAPLLAEGQPVAELDITATGGIVGFDGAPTTSARLAQALDIRVAPTVLFLGRDARELASRLVGVASTDYYGHYLQQRVDAANVAAR